MWQYSITKLSLKCPIWKWKHLKLVETPKISFDATFSFKPLVILFRFHTVFHVPKNGNSLRVIKRHAKGLVWLQRSPEGPWHPGEDIAGMMINVARYRFPTQSDGFPASWGDSNAAVAGAAWFSRLQKRGLRSYAYALILPHVIDLFPVPANLLTDRSALFCVWRKCHGKWEMLKNSILNPGRLDYLRKNNQPAVQVASTFSIQNNFQTGPWWPSEHPASEWSWQTQITNHCSITCCCLALPHIPHISSYSSILRTMLYNLMGSVACTARGGGGGITTSQSQLGHMNTSRCFKI